jgi:hypothetical protein
VPTVPGACVNVGTGSVFAESIELGLVEGAMWGILIECGLKGTISTVRAPRDGVINGSAIVIPEGLETLEGRMSFKVSMTQVEQRTVTEGQRLARTIHLRSS